MSNEAKQAWLDAQLGKDQTDWTIEDVGVCERCGGFELKEFLSKPQYSEQDYCAFCMDAA